MPEQETQKILQEYRERNVRWAERTSSQLSYYNNLLLVLGIGFLSFAYQDSRVADLDFSLKNIDRSATVYILSILTIMLSIITGFVASLSRLYDFRITSHVNQVRRRVFEYHNIKLDEDTPPQHPFIKKMLLPYKLIFIEHPNITLEQCKQWKNDKVAQNKKFSELREIAFNLGLGTWHRIIIQTILIMITIILYVVSILLA